MTSHLLSERTRFQTAAWSWACGRRGQSLVHSLPGALVGEHGSEHGIGGGEIGFAHPVPHRLVEGVLCRPDRTTVGSAETVTAYDSIKADFEDFLTRQLDGRPFVVIGDSQGAAMLNLLLGRLVDDVPALRSRLVTAIILGGNVEVPAAQLVGGTFKHIPACHRLGETGCVIAYSSFPSTPPADSLFGRPGQGVSLQSGQTARQGLQVACVNPAALSGGSASLDSVSPLLRAVSTPWVSYPGLYTARCEQSGGASWLNVTKATGPADHRPTVTEEGGSAYGYHLWDLSLARDDLVSDVAAAEITWTRHHR
jgi:Protein of unknown function (DUF3089)